MTTIKIYLVYFQLLNYLLISGQYLKNGLSTLLYVPYEKDTCVTVPLLEFGRKQTNAVSNNQERFPEAT